MALGGGTFVTQNKTIPGAYINFVTTATGATVFGERGVVALGDSFNWGSNDIFEVTAEDFYKNSMALFGYDALDGKMIGIRDVFKNAKKIYVGRINGNNAKKASCTFGEAKYTGTRGNDIKIAVYSDPDDSSYKNVYTYVGTTIVDTQRVKSMVELRNNNFVVWKSDATLTNTASMPMTGGTNGATTGQAVQSFLDDISGYSFNAITVISDNESINQLVAEYTKRMRNTIGKKFQSIVHNYFADYEGVINIDPYAVSEEDYLVAYWVAGAVAGCEINESLTNKVYDGEIEIDSLYTQSQLENKIKSGEFVFHRVGDKIRVLKDINSFVSVTTEKGKMFQNNQTVRICDQIASDVAVLFEEYYMGKVPNDTSGRNSLWSDLVKYHEKLVNIRALDEFDEEAISVEMGESKNSVVIYEKICPVNSMEQLYMKVTLE
jgi:phage tail sheath protein